MSSVNVGDSAMAQAEALARGAGEGIYNRAFRPAPEGCPGLCDVGRICPSA